MKYQPKKLHPMIEVSSDSLIRACIHAIYEKPINVLVSHFEAIGRKNDHLQDTQTNSFKTGKFTFESRERVMKSKVWPVLDKTLLEEFLPHMDELKNLTKQINATSRMIAFVVGHKHGKSFLQFLPSDVIEIIEHSCSDAPDVPESELERFKQYYAVHADAVYDTVFYSAIS